MTRSGPNPDARRVAVRILDRVFRSTSYADILLDSCFRRIPLQAKDRALARCGGGKSWIGFFRKRTGATGTGCPR
jgi:hypothetical protein